MNPIRLSRARSLTRTHSPPPPPSQGDPRLAPFLSDDFDVTAYASEMLASGTVQAATSALDGGIDALDFALKSEVRAHYDDLLAQLGGMDEADRVLEIVRGGVHALQDTMGRVREEIVEPHRTVSAKTRQLENITRTVDVLHRVVRSLKLSQRLKETMRGIASAGAATASAGDLAKAAKMLGDAREVDREGAGDLAGIDVVDRDARWLASAARDVRARTKAALDAGMSAKSQAEVGAALQVFHNLGELNAAVDAQISSLASEAVDAIRDALDPRALSREMGSGGGGGLGGGSMDRRLGMPPAGQEREWAEALWTRLGAAMDVARARGMSAWHLQRVLAKKRDPITHALFLDETTREKGETSDTADRPSGRRPTPCERFALAFSKGAGEVFQRAHAGAGFARDALLAGYPRLASLLEATHDSLAKESDASGRSAGVPPAVRRDGSDLAVFLRAGDAVANAYLARSFQRLSEPVHALLSPSALQSLQGMVAAGGASSGTVGTRQATEDTRRFLIRVREELDAAANRPALFARVVSDGVCKALRLAAQKAEAGIAVGADARAMVAGQPATSAQRANAALASTLEEVRAALDAIVPMLADEPATALRVASEQLAEAARDAAAPALDAAEERVAALLARAHEEDWADGGPPGEACSGYVSDVMDLLAHVRDEHLSRLPTPRTADRASPSTTPPLAVSARRRLASRCASLFVRHVCMVRALGENGKLRLTKDTGELERAIGETLCEASTLGAPYRALRALRPFLFLATEEVASSPLLDDLPPSCALLHLYSRGPKELATPYQRAGLTPALYSAWLDKHEEAEAWAGVEATLDAYAARRGAEAAADPACRAMRELGAKLAARERDETV